MTAFCHNCGTWTQCHQHHVSFRTAGNMQNVLPLCPVCHNKVHDNQTWAKERGLIDHESRFKYERSYHETRNTPDADIPAAQRLDGCTETTSISAPPSVSLVEETEFQQDRVI